MSGPAVAFPSVFEAAMPRLYILAFHMSGNRTDAFRFMRELAEAPPMVSLAFACPEEALLAYFARMLEDRLRQHSELSPLEIDNILRDDITNQLDVNIRGIDGDPARIHPLLWELKRTCMASMLCCVPAGQRIAIVLTEHLGYTCRAAGELLGLTEPAFRVRLTRARKQLNNIMLPLCQHVDGGNPCHCEGRLASALTKGFISFPKFLGDIPATPHDVGPGASDASALYRIQPTVRLAKPETHELSIVATAIAALDQPEQHEQPDDADADDPLAADATSDPDRQLATSHTAEPSPYTAHWG